jgi:polysaccharide biosynthesis transport protein
VASCIRDLRARFPFIVLDTPPVLSHPDALNLGRLADGVVLVVLANRTSPRALQEARRRLERAEIKILGAVLNRVSPGEAAGVTR